MSQTHVVTTPEQDFFQTLPTEIIVVIFAHLRDNDRWHLACTSTTLLSTFRKYGYFDSIPIYVYHYPTAKSRLEIDWIVSSYYTAVVEHNILKELEVLHPDTREVMFTIVMKSLPDIIRWQWKTIFVECQDESKQNESFLNLFFKYSRDNGATMFIGLQCQKLLAHIQKGADVPNNTKMAIETKIMQVSSDTFDRSSWRNACKSSLPSSPAIKPKKVIAELQEHQLETLGWMKQLESIVRTKTFSFPNALKLYRGVYASFQEASRKDVKGWEIHNFGNGYVWKLLSVENENEVNELCENIQFSVRGGILSDDVGLGKMMTVISLIASNPRPLNQESEYTPLFGQGQERVKYIKTTLVLCPSQLVVPWKKDINSGSKLKCKSCNSFKDCTSKEIGDLDIFIVSFTTFQDIRTKEALAKYGWYRVVIDDVFTTLPTGGESQRVYNVHCQYDYIWYLSPVPFTRKCFVDVMRGLGMKVNNSNVLYREFTQYNQNPSYLPIEHLLVNAVKENCYWKNTKASANLKNIPVKNEIIVIDFSPLERTFYNTSKIMFEALHSTSPYESHAQNIHKDLFSASGLHKTAVQYLPEALLSITWSIECDISSEIARVPSTPRMKAEVDDLQRQLDEAKERGDENEVRTLTTNLGYKESYYQRNVREIREYKAAIESNLKRLQAFEEFLGDNLLQNCEMCGKPKILVRAKVCAHNFCPECAVKRIRDTKTCPQCEQPMQSTDGHPLYTMPVLDVQEDPRLLYGSKTINLGGYLQHLLQQKSTEPVKIVVFASLDYVLNEFFERLCTLDEVTFPNETVYCKGNVAQRTKAMESFLSMEPDSPRILALCKLYYASGILLPNVTHVVMLDSLVPNEHQYAPLKTNPKDLDRLIDEHSIGLNKQVTAVRLVVKDTLEYTEAVNKYGDAIAQQDVLYFPIIKQKQVKPAKEIVESDWEDEEYEDDEPEEEDKDEKMPKRPSRSKSPAKKSKSPKKKETKKRPRTKSPRKSKSPAKKMPKFELPDSDEDFELDDFSNESKKKRRSPRLKKASPSTGKGSNNKK